MNALLGAADFFVLALLLVLALVFLIAALLD